MLTRHAFWLVEEPALDEPADLLTIPEIRHHIAHVPHDDELGLRGLLEMPEAPPSPWWCEEQPSDRRLRPKARHESLGPGNGRLDGGRKA
jgi:hypothetical protein